VACLKIWGLSACSTLEAPLKQATSNAPKAAGAAAASVASAQRGPRISEATCSGMQLEDSCVVLAEAGSLKLAWAGRTVDNKARHRQALKSKAKMALGSRLGSRDGARA